MPKPLGLEQLAIIAAQLTVLQKSRKDILGSTLPRPRPRPRPLPRPPLPGILGALLLPARVEQVNERGADTDVKGAG